MEGYVALEHWHCKSTDLTEYVFSIEQQHGMTLETLAKYYNEHYGHPMFILFVKDRAYQVVWFVVPWK